MNAQQQDGKYAGIDTAFEAVNSLLDASGALESETLQRAVYSLRLEIARAANDTARIAAAESSLQDLNPDLNGLDLTIFEGWRDATHALLSDQPLGTALVDASFGGFVVEVDGCLLALPAWNDGNRRYITEWGIPMDAVEVSRAAWCAPHQSAIRRDALLRPVFITVVFQEQENS